MEASKAAVAKQQRNLRRLDAAGEHNAAFCQLDNAVWGALLHEQRISCFCPGPFVVTGNVDQGASC